MLSKKEFDALAVGCAGALSRFRASAAHAGLEGLMRLLIRLLLHVHILRHHHLKPLASRTFHFQPFRPALRLTGVISKNSGKILSTHPLLWHAHISQSQSNTVPSTSSKSCGMRSVVSREFRRALRSPNSRSVAAPRTCRAPCHIQIRRVSSAQPVVWPEADEATQSISASAGASLIESRIHQPVGRRNDPFPSIDDTKTGARGSTSCTSQDDESGPRDPATGQTDESAAMQSDLLRLADEEPAVLLSRGVRGATGSRDLRRTIAMSRSPKYPIVLLQLLFRRGALTFSESEELLSLLPSDEKLDRMSRRLASHDPRDRDSENCLYVLEGRSDDERCARYLECECPGPRYMLSFLLRPFANITSATTLHSLMESCYSYYEDRCEPGMSATPDVTRGGIERTLARSRDRFCHLLTFMTPHCLQVEPRLVVKLATMAAQFVENLATYADPSGRLYMSQCQVFNKALTMLQPQHGTHPLQRKCPNAYFWEAHRTLLASSAKLTRPLQVSREGFRAIRNVLAGQAKNQTERHNAMRQAPTWPPYLQPADGLDESGDVADGWSRTVNAGVMMQEAGFAKAESDDALDVLQGTAVDGTPTIQQRINVAKGQKRMGVWEASIMATRNAQEAWARFQDPPKPGYKPGLAEFSAMFEKLTLYEEIDGRDKEILPGDKKVSVTTRANVNLTEFEKARLEPPSVMQLYRYMSRRGIKPKGSCLQILVANANSFDTAHTYIQQSSEPEAVVHSLTTNDVDAEQLRAVPMKLMEAYVQMCARVDKVRGSRPLRRGISMVSNRMISAPPGWGPALWGPLLKALSQHRKALKLSLSEHFRLLMFVMDRLGESGLIMLPIFSQLAKCLRKILKWETADLVSDLGSAELASRNRLMGYYSWHLAGLVMDETVDLSLFYQMKTAADRLKSLFAELVEREERNHELAEIQRVAPLDRMACRTDPVGSEQAYEYMISMAYLGEFEEMAKTLRWLIEEWSRPEVAAAVRGLGEPPAYANFFEVLCAFRTLAEPMLDEAIVESLQQEVEASATGWVWPDAVALATFADLQPDVSILELRRALEVVRHRLPALHAEEAARRSHEAKLAQLKARGLAIQGVQDDMGRWRFSERLIEPEGAERRKRPRSAAMGENEVGLAGMAS